MNEDKLLKSLESLYADLLWLDGALETDSQNDDLMKGPNYYRDKDPKKYRQMLNKLKKERKTPGSKERGYQQVLQAKRRQSGSSGTTAGQHGHKGHAKGKLKEDTGKAAAKYAKAEKKYGRKMSPDRVDNNKGYESSNVKLAPQEYNRGDEQNKKKKEWYKKQNKKK